MNRHRPFSSIFPQGANSTNSSQDHSSAASPEDFSHSSHQQQGHHSNHAKQRAHEAYISPEEPIFSPGTSGDLGGLFPDAPADNQQTEQGHIDDATLKAMCDMRICPECPVKKEADDARLRAMADLENTRKRMLRESEEQKRFAAESVLSDIIPSLDNLNLALQHADGNEACKDYVIGVQMTRNLMMEALKKHGLEAVGKVGEEFNPAVHEAVGLTWTQDVPEGHIASLISQGYTLNNRLLRPARVIVCKSE